MALQIAALNDPTRGGGRHGSAAARAAARRTTEAEESRLTSKYEHALLFMRDGALEDAERELRSILDHDMMSGPPNHRPVAHEQQRVLVLGRESGFLGFGRAPGGGPSGGGAVPATAPGRVVEGCDLKSHGV